MMKNLSLTKLKARASGELLLSASPSAQCLVSFEGFLVLAGRHNKIEDRILNKEYDSGNIALCKMLIRPGDYCIDVGANIGIYTLLFASLCGPSGEVHAFEPVEHCRRKLYRNVRINRFKNVRLNAVALGDRVGEVEMNVVKEGEFRAGTSTLTQNDNVAEMGEDKFDRNRVEMATLDSYAEGARLDRLNFVKVDIEGAEIQFLAGAQESLNTHRPMILIEHNQRRLELLKIPEDRFAKVFSRLRYECFDLVFRAGSINLIPYNFDRKMRGTNMIAIPLP